MSTWAPAPSVTVQAIGGDSPLTGKFGSERGQTFQQPPSPPFVGGLQNGVGLDGTDVFSTG